MQIKIDKFTAIINHITYNLLTPILTRLQLDYLKGTTHNMTDGTNKCIQNFFYNTVNPYRKDAHTLTINAEL